MSDYNAESIRVLTDAEIAERFVFTRAARLADRYPHVSLAFIVRMLTACEHSRFPESSAIRRYLDGDRTTEVTEAFIEAHRAIVEDERRRAWARPRKTTEKGDLKP
jgi:hypothetical protein